LSIPQERGQFKSTAKWQEMPVDRTVIRPKRLKDLKVQTKKGQEDDLPANKIMFPFFRPFYFQSNDISVDWLYADKSDANKQQIQMQRIARHLLSPKERIRLQKLTDCVAN
jgi:hypothetical protein